MRRTLLCMIAAIFVCAATAGADQPAEVALDSKIDTISLFKNGMAVVDRTVQIPGPGVYRLNSAITPVLGTFWVDADASVEARVTMRSVDSPARLDSYGSFQQELVGKQVTVHFHDATIPPASGKVVELAQPRADEQFSRDYVSPQNGGPQISSSSFLVLQTDKGRSYVSAGSIEYMDSNAGSTVHERRPVLLLTVGPEKKGASALHVSYLTRGIAWSPSYRVRLLDDKNLVIEQQAVIKNELEDLTDCEVRLISGFPSVQFGNVDSLISLNQTWTNFFGQLNGSGQQIYGAISQNAAAVTNNVFGGGASGGENGVPRPAAMAAADDVDVHYFSVGKRTMDQGDALAMRVAQNQAGYERLVQWAIPDPRDSGGNAIEQRDANNNIIPLDTNTAWDAVRFKNPLPFAMTAAPAMVIDDGRFAGQQLSQWVNTGEQTTLHITKALSLRTQMTEQEDNPNNRAGVVIGGRNYQKLTITGKLEMENRRTNDVKILVSREYSGEIINADENPTIKGRNVSGFGFSVNPPYEMDWTVALKAGETKTLKYSYTVLIPE